MDRRDDSCCPGGGGGVSSLIGEFVGDVVMWRRGDVSACLLAATVSGWLLFGSGGYTFLSLASNVLLLLLTVLFLWAKAARLLNRPEPPIPEMRISQQVVNEVAALLHSGMNTVFSVFHDIALGKDSVLFYQVFLSLWIISIIGSLTDFTTLCYTIALVQWFGIGMIDRKHALFLCLMLTGIVAVLTIPALYQKYEECIDRYMRFAYLNLQMYEMVYERFSAKCFHRARDLVIEVLKEP
uniref:Reticulon-like protein n=1 Tax=Oryza nivara TaxID=4536 RepID=A0A0E0GZM2_ORYNI